MDIFRERLVVDDKKHTTYKELTDLIKIQMQKLDVVMPRRYALLFTDLAKELMIDLNKEEIDISEDIDDKVAKHVEQLSNSATKAVDAIERKDDIRLKEVLSETQSLREEIEQLRSAVYEDTLTKVYNRRWMEEHFLTKDKNTFAIDGVLAMVDMNDFKYINDTFGHISGDKVLYYVATQLKRTDGNVVRYGGDEFFVLFDKEMTKDRADMKMHNIRELVIKKQLRSEGKKFRTSFSYGMTPFSIGDRLDAIVQLADEEMYEDKIQIKERLNK